jgi:hypothetical protein
LEIFLFGIQHRLLVVYRFLKFYGS